MKKSAPSCPLCGNTALVSREAFDIFCLVGPTVEFECLSCGVQWYDDTAAPVKRKKER